MKEFTAVVTLKLDVPVKAIDMARAERECRLMVEQLKLLLMRAGVEGVTVSRMEDPSEAIKRAGSAATLTGSKCEFGKITL